MESQRAIKSNFKYDGASSNMAFYDDNGDTLFENGIIDLKFVQFSISLYIPR